DASPAGRGGVEHDKIHGGRGAAEGGGFVTGVMIIGGHGAEHRQIQMDASITSALGCWRFFPIREIVSPSIKISASKVSEAVMSVPFLINVVMVAALCIVGYFHFLYPQ